MAGYTQESPHLEGLISFAGNHICYGHPDICTYQQLLIARCDAKNTIRHTKRERDKPNHNISSTENYLHGLTSKHHSGATIILPEMLFLPVLYISIIQLHAGNFTGRNGVVDVKPARAITSFLINFSIASSSVAQCLCCLVALPIGF